MFKPVLMSLALLSAANLTLAADPVTEAMQKTYVPYRVALFKTNNNAPEESRQAVLQARQGWAAVREQFGANPPAPYAGDAGFAPALAAVDKVYAKALDEIGRNQLTVAHETLEEVRDILADLRRRNQVVVFSDHMNAYHAEMEHLLDDGEKILAASNGWLELTAKAGALDYLAQRLKSEAPASLQKNEEFTGLLKAVEKSVVDLKAVLFAQDAAKVKEAIGNLKKPYSRLFIKFG